ncbi:hypothetical protein ACH79_16395 [Bradyrhizobium sp. CCBAU 051011]|uniref:hypothetical protein n=1 Tax=Bradyrhizobium sp. CCBAU 051011 TaxID=858422 RepID=UPI00137395D5|nr:hypothetical protein [Bradyrhizobium sp. CCBAU 051011]QHO73976.1 hypothetical protein ACH79_16395 [Bradyrhizobium sp. CCBAU 051011]
MTENDKLPAKAHAKIVALVDQEQQASTLMRSTLRQIGELRNSLNTNSVSQHAAINKEVERLDILREKHADRHRQLADLNTRIRHFLEMLPADAALDDAKAVKIKLKPGETHQQVITELRLKIIELLGERSQVERAALPIEEIKAQAKKWITQRAIAGRPAIIATHDKFDVRFTAMDPAAYTPMLDPFALLAFFDPEHLETKLNKMIDEMPKPQFALTPAAKAERLASIAAELGNAERLECALIDAAQDEGSIVSYRPNTDIEALLGIVVTKSEAKAA